MFPDWQGFRNGEGREHPPGGGPRGAEPGTVSAGRGARGGAARGQVDAHPSGHGTGLCGVLEAAEGAEDDEQVITIRPIRAT